MASAELNGRGPGSSVMSPWWRLRHSWSVRVILLAFRRHSMCRKSDRVEAATLLSVAVLSVLAIPLAVVVAMSFFSSSMVTVRHQSSERHQVVATVVSTSGGQSLKTMAGESAATVVWRDAHGRRGQDVIPVVGVPEVGSRLTVWIASDGHRVPAPLTRSQAQVQADAVGIAVATGVLGVAYLLLFTVQRVLLRRRVRAWDAEWIEVGSEHSS